MGDSIQPSTAAFVLILFTIDREKPFAHRCPSSCIETRKKSYVDKSTIEDQTQVPKVWVPRTSNLWGLLACRHLKST